MIPSSAVCFEHVTRLHLARVKQEGRRELLVLQTHLRERGIDYYIRSGDVTSHLRYSCLSLALLLHRSRNMLWYPLLPLKCRVEENGGTSQVRKRRRASCRFGCVGDRSNKEQRDERARGVFSWKFRRSDVICGEQVHIVTAHHVRVGVARGR